ncbi:Methyltransf-25 domain-containing protein [Mycena sanguinolenta]|uniref:Methyltransf-25 domain-containing protein n=1 Tax=Mycena sanguinolenta TaxID=230812 RepID=A0A8H6XTG9_9AGAR|nr:Methyltransf-25 domain-containing protein [Mycena sanguinolenta]
MSKRPATSPGPSARLMDIAASSADGGGLRKRHSSSFAPVAPDAAMTVAPPRPPRNPARAAQEKPKKPKRPSTATGTREEVTPWEFFPNNTPTEDFPVLTSDDTAIKPETATGKREDVVPWELFPAPAYDATDPDPAAPSALNGSQPNHTRSARTSVSYPSASSLAEMALLRRRKSTGAKAPSSPLISQAHTTASPRPSTSPHAPNTSPSKTPSRVLSKAPPASFVPRPSIPERSSSGPVPTLASMDSMDTITPHHVAHLEDPKFSTADRTILVELKRNISARAAQFVIKGGPAGAAAGEGAILGRSASTKRAGSKHHAYNRDDVPYPRSYAREVLDLCVFSYFHSFGAGPGTGHPLLPSSALLMVALAYRDVWETMACQRICDSLTFHVFTTPPTKVLDIGCGTGTWILNCGKAWKKCHFVGLDVVPLHPDVGTSELSTRITWVQANFLEGLPFPNDEFDYVHIKRIALGVPEDKWDALFEEVSRVLKSGGAFELIEEDLFFPGKSITEDADSDSDVSELRYARNDSASDDNEDDVESVITGSGGSRKSYDGSAPTPNTSLGAAGTPPRTSSPLPMIGSLIRGGDRRGGGGGTERAGGPS